MTCVVVELAETISDLMNGIPMLDRIANPHHTSSLAAHARQNRMMHFRQLIAPLPCPVNILDVGGSARYWQSFGANLLPTCRITLLNLGIPKQQDANFIYCKGDGCDMHEFAAGSFDVVFSNSVIEHVTTWQNQQRMAAEIQRVGVHHFVQTPNYWFPIEPHFLWPGLQWLPMPLRLRFINTFGSLRQPLSRSVALGRCRDIRLLTPGEMSSLFPNSKIVHERVVGLSKSMMAIG